MAAIPQAPAAGLMLDIISQWITQNAGRIVQAQRLNGGWEGWAQVELAFFLQPRYPNHDLLREERIYVDRRQRADIWLRARVPTEKNRGIELKCRSAQETSAQFITRFSEDMELIENHPAPDREPCALYAIGISTDAADTRGWADRGAVYYHSIVDAQWGTIYMIWQYQDQKGKN